MNFITFTIKRQTLYCWIRKYKYYRHLLFKHSLTHHTDEHINFLAYTYCIHAHYVSLYILRKLSLLAHILHRYAEIIAEVVKSSRQELSSYRTLVVHSKPQKELPWSSKFIKAIYDVSKIESVLTLLYYMLNKLNFILRNMAIISQQAQVLWMGEGISV